MLRSCRQVAPTVTQWKWPGASRRWASRSIPGLTRQSGKRTVWNGLVREDRQSLAIPYAWKKPRKIFVNSMSDLFHERVSDSFIKLIWQVMRETPRHRPRSSRSVRSGWRNSSRPKSRLSSQTCGSGQALKTPDVVERIDHLRAAPAAIRFISFEPLIGPVGEVDLAHVHWAECRRIMKGERPVVRTAGFPYPGNVTVETPDGAKVIGDVLLSVALWLEVERMGLDAARKVE